MPVIVDVGCEVQVRPDATSVFESDQMVENDADAMPHIYITSGSGTSLETTMPSESLEQLSKFQRCSTKPFWLI